MARRMKLIRAELMDALGGPEIVTPQRQLIIEGLSFRVIRAQMLIVDALNDSEGFTEEADRRVNWHLNAIRADLQTLGLDRPEEQAPTLAAYIEGRAA